MTAQSTDDIKKVLTLLLDGVSVVVAAEADGKIALDDAALLIKLVPDLAPAISSMSAVPAELAALDSAQAADLVAFTMAKLTIQDAHATAIVDASLKALSAAWNLIQVVKNKP